jgi:small GTP-binding protein
MNKFKTVIVGDSNVGKSSILLKLVHRKFKKKKHPTIGIDFFAYRFKKNNKQIKLILWDTAGQDKFESIVKIYFKDVHILFVVADICNNISCINIKKWIEKVCKENINSSIFKDNNVDNIPIIVLFNKVDKRNINTLQSSDCKNIIKDLSFKYKNIKHIELSALNGRNFEKLQNIFIDTIFDNYNDILIKSENNDTNINYCYGDRYKDVDNLDKINCCNIN